MSDRLTKWLAVVTLGCCTVLGAGSCLPDGFWPSFLGDTIISGVASALLASALAAAGV